ncbi:MAG: 3-dehydroquinate synthase [Candidatus Binatia bacterium]
MSAREVRVNLGERSYSVRVEAGLLDRTGELVAGLGERRSTLIVTNPTVAALYLERVERSVRDAGCGAPLVVEIADGERFKHMATVERIYDAALGHGVDRSSVIVALGGGVVGDVAGFAAATLLRGIDLVMVPTTLLAQVDSSIGGKTGINRPQGKNLIGAFHQPSLVISDAATLASLPAREYSAGLAEVVKYGMILDAGLFELLEARAADVVARDGELLSDIVARSAALKARVVERDEREGGLRAILNFGHTVGHAVEQATGYSRYLHGETVAMGMAAAVRLSERRGACDDSVGKRLRALIEAVGLSWEIPSDVDRDRVEHALAFDKKIRRERLTFIVSTAIGGCDQIELPMSEVMAAL